MATTVLFLATSLYPVLIPMVQCIIGTYGTVPTYVPVPYGSNNLVQNKGSLEIVVRKTVLKFDSTEISLMQDLVLKFLFNSAVAISTGTVRYVKNNCLVRTKWGFLYENFLLRDRDTRFDLAKSGIIGKILMSRAHGRPLKNFKVLFYIFYLYF